MSKNVAFGEAFSTHCVSGSSNFFWQGSQLHVASLDRHKKSFGVEETHSRGEMASNEWLDDARLLVFQNAHLISEEPTIESNGPSTSPKFWSRFWWYICFVLRAARNAANRFMPRTRYIIYANASLEPLSSASDSRSSCNRQRSIATRKRNAETERKYQAEEIKSVKEEQRRKEHW